MEEKNNHPLQGFLALGKTAKTAIYCAVGLAVVLLILAVIFSPSGETTAQVKTALKEVLESSELSTSQYSYHSIAKVLIDPKNPSDENNVKYQVAYRGTVKCGFDFQQLQTVEKDGSLVVVIPKIQILSVSVDPDMEYIFSDAKYDTESTYADAFFACNEDLAQKAKTNRTLFATAIESAVETVSALTKPFESRLEEGKTIKIVYTDDFVTEENQ